MKYIYNTLKPAFIASIFALFLLAGVHEVHAESITFSTDTDPCPATFTASIPGNLTAGQQVTITGSVSMSAPCQIDGPAMSFSSPSGSGSIELTSDGSWTYYSGSAPFTVPSSNGTYNIDFTAHVSSNLGGGPVYTGGTLTITVGPTTGYLTVNKCFAGDSFIVSGNGQMYTSSPGEVQPGTYSISYTASSGYHVSAITPASSQNVAAGESKSFTVTCERNVQPPVVQVSSSPSALSCNQSSTITWTSQNAESCSNSFNSSTALSGSATVSPTANQTYTVTCTNFAGSTTGSTDVTYQCTPPPTDPEVSVSLAPVSSTVNKGSSKTLTWTSTGAMSCRASYPAGWTGSTALSGSATVSPTATTTYIMTCSNATKEGSAQATVNVVVPPTETPVTVSLSPTSSTINSGSSKTLTWSSTGATSCNASFPASWTGSTALSGSATVSPTATTTYIMTCSNATSQNSAQAVVYVVPPATDPDVTVSLTPASSTISEGGSKVLTWSSTGATSCSATDPVNWTTSTALSGSATVSPTATTTYTMTCRNATKQKSAQATVNVTPTTYAWISVYTNISNSAWTLNPGNATGYGNGMKTPVVSSATLFTLTPETLANYSYAVTNSDGGASSMTVSPGDTKSFTITYTADPSWDYTLSNSGALTVTKSATADAYGSETINKNLTTQSGSPTGTFSVDIPSAPSGVEYAFSNASCKPTCTTTINFTVKPTASAGTYPVTVTSNPGGKSTTFNLIIENAQGGGGEGGGGTGGGGTGGGSSAPAVSCTPSASSAKVGDTVTWTGGVSGGTAPYTYSWSGSGIPASPAPSTQNYSIKYTTVGTKTATLQVMDASGQTGACTPAGSIRIDFNPTFQEF